MRNALICLLILAAGPASALSCMRPDAVRLFEAARDAEEGYYIVKGEVALLEPANVADPQRKTVATTRARVTGYALGRTGFRARFERDIQVEASCLASWCGSAEGLDGERLMAIRVDDGALTLPMGPCASFTVNWDQSGEDRLLACYQNGVCEAADF